MDNRVIDDIALTMREIFETAEETMIQKVNISILKGDSRNELLLQLRRSSEETRKLLDLVTERAGKVAGFNPKKVKEENKRGSSLLLTGALVSYNQGLRNVKRLEKTLSLADAIFNQTQKGIDKGISVKVGNRTYGYKEYMEMNVRTTVQNEVGEQQLEIGQQQNVLFYICNVFGDCADDHVDYQGKIYYDEKVNVKGVEIPSGMLSVQEVRDGKPYLTTRPNCRHTFTPISIQQALNVSPEYLTTALGLRRGSYRPTNYDKTQQQRYNERQIRKYKARARMNEELATVSGNDKYKEQALKDKALTSKWQKEQRKLLKDNPSLERDYRRETREKLLQDLGARYR